MSATEPPASLSVQQADALWNAIAVPGPRPPAYPEQWERVCRTVARIIADLTPGDDETGTPQAVILSTAERAMLIYALDQAQERIWAEDGFTDEDQAAVDSLRRMADETATTQTQPISTTPLAAGLPLVKGNCPACGNSSLFLGHGGYVTCSHTGCPEPDAASTALEQFTSESRKSSEA